MEQSRETTVLFAALIGSQDLYAKAGAEKGHEAMERCHLRVGQAAASCGGRLASATGDKLMVLTATPDVAADAACAMLLAIDKLPSTAEVRLGMGIGFHFGPVIQKNDEVFGDTVVLAARLSEHAGNGQILLTEWTAKLLSPLYRGWLRNLESARIKGRAEEIALCELVWRADDDATAYTRRQPSDQKPVHTVLYLVHKGRTLERRRDKDFVTIGRGDDCGLVVPEEGASRQHCRIERRKDKWVLVDLSTNGTYVTIEGDREMALNKEELVLSRKGWITLGQPRVHAAETIEFSVEEK